MGTVRVFALIERHNHKDIGEAARAELGDTSFAARGPRTRASPSSRTNEYRTSITLSTGFALEFQDCQDVF